MGHEPPALAPEQIARNFADIQGPLDPDRAKVEAARCLFCFEAPCITACPTHIDVPAFIHKILHGNVRGAARVILDANPLGASCARVCPVEALCEGACVLNHGKERPVAIGHLQRHATDWFAAEGMPPLFTPAPDNGRRVALVGAGPASLGCAAALRRLGYATIVFERDPEPGGLNTYGIAQYKMTPEDSRQEIAFVQQLGVSFRTGVEIGRDVGVQELLDGFDAVFLGIGLGNTRRLGIPGEDKEGVLEALEFIRAYKTRPYGAFRVGRRVVVVGAGNTAIDVATAAVRLGAERTTIVYRRTRADMPAYDYEYELAQHDGVIFEWLAAPVEVLGAQHVEGLRCMRMQPGPPDARGRTQVQPLPDATFVVEADMVVAAVGQAPRTAWLEAIPGLELRHGVVVVDPDTGMTSVPGLFAGGDCANGGMEVVNAVAEGQRAARGIDAWLSAAAPKSSPSP